jgi:hypothetical protein
MTDPVTRHNQDVYDLIAAGYNEITHRDWVKILAVA